MIFWKRSCGRVFGWLAVVGLLVATGGCTLNPATGQRQLTLISEQQEIAMGRDYSKVVQAQLGLVDDQKLQDYVQELGAGLAATSERPNLPWQFRVVDDPTVNAFALPGGYIYVTRGILAHFNSEAELVTVLGHEIGHVTARHSVEQMSRAQLAQIGLGVAVMASEEFRQYAGLASLGMQVLFLKFSRDDEMQSDDLGLRYLTRGGYDPREMPGVFEMLGRQSALAGGQRIPEWQSTHPDPDRRAERLTEQISALPETLRSGKIERDSYLNRLQLMVFGSDPRQGYTVGSTFYHPEMAFMVDYPAGWEVINQRQAVIGVSPEKDALVALSLAEEKTPAAAAEAFFAAEGVQRGQKWQQQYYNFSTTPQADPQTGESSFVRGAVGFVNHGGQVFRLLSYAPSDLWKNHKATVRRAITSFSNLSDKRRLDVEPKRVKIVRINRAQTLQEFNKRAPSTIDLQALAVLNGVTVDQRLAAGTLVKRVVGAGAPSK